MRVLIAEPFAEAPAVLDRLRALVPGLDILVWPGCGQVGEADLLVSWQIPKSLDPLPSGLKAVFCYGAGVEKIVGDKRISPTLPVLRLLDPGQAGRMLDHALAAAFIRLTRLDDYRHLQSREIWFSETLPVVGDRALSITILGLGQIGAKVATGLAEARFSVRGFAQTERTLPGVSVHAGREALGAAANDADLLINILPSRPALHRIIDADLLSRLAPNATVVNFGRGDHVDLDALRAALDGNLGAAWLDVFPVEPLPSDHWAWRHPKIRITPHAAGLPSPDGAANSLAAAILAIREGRPLPGMVARE